MCWKQEWASAINNLQHAIEHIEKAQTKLEKREEQFKKSLEKRHNDKYEANKIRERLWKNHDALTQCKVLIVFLKSEQEELFNMTQKYGISKSDDPKRVYKLMGKFPYEEYLKKYGET